MSIFDLPCWEYIEAQEKIMIKEASVEALTAEVVARMTGEPQSFTKRITLANYNDSDVARHWHKRAWRKQHESHRMALK